MLATNCRLQTLPDHSAAKYSLGVDRTLAAWVRPVVAGRFGELAIGDALLSARVPCKLLMLNKI